MLHRELVVLLCATLVQKGYCDIPGNVHQDKRADWAWTFASVSPSGIKQCIRMCSLNGHCRSVTFDRSQLACHLNNRDFDPGYLITDGGYVFINNISGTQGLVKNCAQNNCGSNESCISLNSGFACINRTICGHELYSHDSGTNTCYRFVNSPLLNWTDAEKYCQMDGAHLISLHNEQRANLIRQQIKSPLITPRYWIGVNDRDTENEFRWTDGTLMEYSNWSSGYAQPNNKDGIATSPANCVVVKHDGTWADDSCQNETGFICEIDLPRLG